MSGFTLESALLTRKGAQFQRTYLWRLELPDLTLGTTNQFVNIDRQQLFSDYNLNVPTPDMVNWRIRSVNTPFFSTDTEKEVNGSSNWTYAKKYEIGNMTVDVQEVEPDVGESTFEYFNAWTALQTHPTRAKDGPAAGTFINLTTNPPAYYKMPIRFFRLNTVKMDMYVDTYEGCFITNISDITNDYENSGLLSYSVTLAVDSMQSRVYYTNTVLKDTITLLNQKVDNNAGFGGLTTDAIRKLIPGVAGQFGL